MNLREYLIGKMASEESTIDNLLEIDNTIELTNLTKEDIIFTIKQTYDNKLNGFDGEEFDVICDGELNSFFYIILNYGEKIKNIYVDESFLGICTYIVARTNEFFKENNIEKKIVLDDSHDKRKYLNSTRKIIICGTDEFVIDTSNLLKDKDTYTVMF